MQDGCQFKKLIPKEQWIFEPSYGGRGPRKLRMPKYGHPPEIERAKKRCPLCNRRLILKARYCYGGEFVFWEIPAHKPRETRKPGLKRQSKMVGRGK